MRKGDGADRQRAKIVGNFTSDEGNNLKLIKYGLMTNDWKVIILNGQISQHTQISTYTQLNILDTSHIYMYG